MDDFNLISSAAAIHLNARSGKNAAIIGNQSMEIFLTDSQDGDEGHIVIAVDGTGGYRICMSSQFSEASGGEQICGDANAVNYIHWFNVHGTLGYSVSVKPGYLKRTLQRYVLPMTGSKAGTGAGWVVAAANNTSLVTLPASSTASTLVLPVLLPLKVGSVITGFSVIGQIESAGGAVTLSCELRKHTAAAADVADATVGGLAANVSVTADAILSATNASKTGLAEVVAADETFYFLITASTAGSTDIALQGVTITISEL